MIFNYFKFQWEPGFNGGFDQEFIYRVREVSLKKKYLKGVFAKNERGVQANGEK